MKITLYKFFKAYFGDFSKGNINYARAIGDATDRISAAYSIKKKSRSQNIGKKNTLVK